MNQATLLKIINPFLLMSFFMQVFTGITGYFYTVHEYNGFVLVSLALSHLYFNRHWIINSYFKKRK
jgi:hypothetical protein